MKHIFWIFLILNSSNASAINVSSGEYRICAPMFVASDGPTLIFNFRTRQQVKVRLKGPKAEALVKQLEGAKAPSRKAYSFQVSKNLKAINEVDGFLLGHEDCRRTESVVNEVVHDFKPRVVI